MTLRSVVSLGLVLVATPLSFVGCSNSNDKKPDGSYIVLDEGLVDVPAAKPDGKVATDGGLAQDAPVADALIAPDRQDAQDAQDPQDAPIAQDAPASDGGVADATLASDGLTGPCTEAVKFVGGEVTTSTTLTTACSPYTISSTILVNGNATLTIEPGVVLRFNPDTAIDIGRNSAGKLSAMGTATAPIVLTSANETPGAGDWTGVKLWGNTMNGTKLNYAVLDYCGAKDDACLVGKDVKSNHVAIDHVTFSHVGTGANAILETDTDSNFFITNCTFNDISNTPTQQFAISVYAPSFAGIDGNNLFNGEAMVELRGGYVTADTTWQSLGTTVAVTSQLDIGGPTTPTLTIAAGSVFKFASGIAVSIGYADAGKLILAGTANSPITFTSLAATPKPSDWGGIILWDDSSAKIAYATIAYAGSSKSSATGAVYLLANSDGLDIQNSTLAYSGSYGIGIPCGSTATLVNTSNTFTGNLSGNIGPGPDATGTACQ